MPNKVKKSQPQQKKPQPAVVEKNELPSSQPQEAVLPAYQPIDFNAPPAHLDVLTKKIRATKKKLRRIAEAEKNKDSGKKLDAEQERILADKAFYERVVKDYEEIKNSLTNIDFTVQIRLLLGAIYGAYACGADSPLWPIALVLLPPNVPPEGLQHLNELQHASIIAQKFLQGSDEKLTPDSPSFTELREEVIKYLTPDASFLSAPASTKKSERPVKIEEPVEVPAAVESVVEASVPPSEPSEDRSVEVTPEKTESETLPTEAVDAAGSIETQGDSKEDDPKRKSNRNFKNHRGGNYRRGNRGNFRERSENSENGKGVSKGSPGGDKNRGGARRGNRGGGSNRGRDGGNKSSPKPDATPA